jgi:predicted Zn-dependent protease
MLDTLSQAIAVRLAALAALAVSGLLAGCTTNPATGQTYFNALSREEEIAVGEQATPELLEQYGGRVEDQRINTYVTNLGRTLSEKTEGDYPTLPWEFYLLDSEVINAFALPGGKVFISRGLASKMDNEAQLAGVLGHEIAHVTAQHVDQRVTQQMSAQFGLSVLSIFLGQEYQLAQQAAELAAGGVVLKFSREQELEADALGMRYMNRAGYSPVGQRQVMQILRDATAGARQLEFFSTHPYPETRIERINALLAEKYPDASSTENLYPGRFRESLLEPLSRLPAPQQSAFRLHQPHTWCAVCAAGSE